MNTDISLRAPQPGDIGWVIERHGLLYAREFGWTLAFEGLVAQIAGRFVERQDPAREAAWIARRGSAPDGERLGCVFLVQARDETTDTPLPGTAQLRLLLLEPAARGTGLGTRLVAQCTQFARAAGYQRIQLWTQSLLAPARVLYAREGYERVSSERHHSFGHDLIGEMWEKPL